MTTIVHALDYPVVHMRARERESESFLLVHSLGGRGGDGVIVVVMLLLCECLAIVASRTLLGRYAQSGVLCTCFTLGLKC